MDEMSSLFQRFLRAYKMDQVIFEEAQRGNEMFIVHSGKVRIEKKTTSGKAKLLATLGPGEFFGEMALIDDSPRSASAVAAEDDTRLIVLDKPKFIYMVQQLPDFSFAIMQKLAERIRNINAQGAMNGSG